ncbi:mitochondrial distribution and morphology protein 34 [Cryptococcus floricola]|uniref:Mitochondrial distribution and morphology protein 34 n=1 Tax=Cryptococcus floricola TaxID=2591691 RepID=A0A5D3B269_9TREE|nr:mitochondrial distribution and morphology protein 34 [Cryptococcus floricola]
MSFVFPSWSTAFSPAFHEDAKAMLEGALNKGNKPPVIQGRIEVVELHMGEQPPTLTLLEIGDLSLDRFRGILRLGYQGDAWLEVRCRVQANPLSHNPHLTSSTLPLSTPLIASQPLLVPMTLRLSKLNLRAILILVVSASKGITLVFKNDPLQNVEVSSTFDSVEVIRGYLQQEIEGQLREMFREDLPGIIHRLSQKWFSGGGVGGRVEMPYRDAPPPAYGPSDEPEDAEASEEQDIFPPPANSGSPEKTVDSTPRRASIARAQSRRSNATTAFESPTSFTSFPDIEDYDPTYGLRPEGLPTHSGYEAFGRLWEKARQGQGRGLGSLIGMGGEDLEEGPEQDFGDPGDVSDGDWDQDDGRKSLDMVEMDHALRAIPTPSRNRSPVKAQRRRQSVMSGNFSSATTENGRDGEQVEWETFPAVGGGVVSRPRVFHVQSQIRAPSEAGGAMPSPSATATGGSVTARASSVGAASSTIGSLRMRPLNSISPGIASPGIFTPGSSNLRRMVTSRSDVFLASPAYGKSQLPRAESFAALPPSSYKATPSRPLSYGAPSHHRPRHSVATGSSSAARTSGSSWGETDGPSRSATLSTMASSQRPPSKQSASSKARPMSVPLPVPGSRLKHERVPSVSVTGTSPGNAHNGSFPPRHTGPNGITLPLNNSVSQLATLSHSAHTLSPYARGHEHIAVRSFPYHLARTRSGSGSGAWNGAGASGSGSAAGSVVGMGGLGELDVKARRKRIFKIGKGNDGDSP